MATRPNQNWEARQLDSRGPQFRIDVKNPQMGFNGSDLYQIYSFNDNQDVNLAGFTEGGTYKIYSDRHVEIISGSKSEEEGTVDVNIVGLNGDVCITAARNGRVRIKAKNIMVEADEDLDLKGGRNVTISAGSGRVLTEANKIDVKALTGNGIVETFGMKVFSQSFVGSDLITSTFSNVAPLIGGAVGGPVGSAVGSFVGGLF